MANDRMYLVCVNCCRRFADDMAFYSITNCKECENDNGVCLGHCTDRYRIMIAKRYDGNFFVQVDQFALYKNITEFLEKHSSCNSDNNKKDNIKIKYATPELW